MSGPRILDSSAGKPVKLGKYELTEEKIKNPEEQWAIVQEVGVGQWFGKITEWDKDKRVMTLHPALALSSIPRIPIALVTPGEPIEGVVTGNDMKGIMGRQAYHPVRDLAYSSYQLAADFDADFVRYCFLMAGIATGAKKKQDVERELSAPVQGSKPSVILPQ
jgi:hypothetical protein